MVTRVDANGDVWGFSTIESARRYYPEVVLEKTTGLPEFRVPHGSILAGWYKGTRPYDPTKETVSIAPIVRFIHDNTLEWPSLNHLDWTQEKIVDTFVSGIKDSELQGAPMSDHSAVFLAPLKPASTDALCTGLFKEATLDDLMHNLNRYNYAKCADAAKAYCKANPDDTVYCACMTQHTRCDTTSMCYDADPKTTFLMEPHYADPGLSCGTDWAFANGQIGNKHGPIMAGMAQACSSNLSTLSNDVNIICVVIVLVLVFIFLLVLLV